MGSEVGSPVALDYGRTDDEFTGTHPAGEVGCDGEWLADASLRGLVLLPLTYVQSFCWRRMCPAIRVMLRVMLAM